MMYQNILTTKSGVIQCYQCVGFFSLPPANEVCEGYVFTGVCLSTQGGGMHGFIRGGMCGFIWGGHAWFYSGGACMVLFGGGMCGFNRDGAVRGFSGGGMRGFFSFFEYNEIRSMSGRYASYWNAFLSLCVNRQISYRSFMLRLVRSLL